MSSSPSRSSAIGPVIGDSIAAGESFVRFICSRSQFAPKTGRVKPQAVDPRYNSRKGRYETSVHRTVGLTEAQTWALGYAHVENPAEDRIVKASGIGPFDILAICSLQADVNGAPFPRHVDIVGWSRDSKDARLMRATEIADRLRLQIDPRTAR